MRINKQRQRSLFRRTGAQGFGVFIVAISFSFGLIGECAAARKHSAPTPPSAARRANRASVAACAACEGSKGRGRKNAKVAKTVPCHPKGYVDPKVAKNYQKAMRELHRDG